MFSANIQTHSGAEIGKSAVKIVWFIAGRDKPAGKTSQSLVNRLGSIAENISYIMEPGMRKVVARILYQI